VVLFLSTSFPTNAQNQGPDLKFTNVSAIEGLSNNFVNDITQDSFGFIWVGTTDGLCRFDSKDDFKIFEKNGELDLKSSNIRSLLVDSKNMLWIGTRLGGLTSYNLNTRESKNYQHSAVDSSTISNNEILSIFEDSKGRIWIGTESGLNLFNPETETFKNWIPQNDNDSSLPANAILTIYEDSRGFIWVGSWAGGLTLILNSASENVEDFTFRNFSMGQSVAAANVWCILEDNQKRIWIGTHGGGLFLLDIPTVASNKSNQQDWALDMVNFKSNTSPSLSSNTVDNLYLDKTGNLWLATTAGLHFLNKKQVEKEYTKTTRLFFKSYKHDTKDQSSLAGSVTNKIFNDKDGTFWVGTINGLSKFTTEQKQIEYIPLSVDQDLNHLNNNFLVQKDSLIWFCGNNGGMYTLRVKDKKVEKFNVPGIPKGTELLTIFQEDEKFIIGANKNIFILDPATKKVTSYEAPEEILRITNFLFSRFLFIDDRNLIYISTEYGLVTLDRERNEFKHYQHDENNPSSLSDNSINEIVQTSDGTIWLASYKGLNKIVSRGPDGLKFKSFLNSDGDASLGSNQVTSLEEIDGALYIGTTFGLSKLDLKTETLSNLTIEAENAYILSLESDDQGNLWYSTSDGITRFNTKTNTYRNYDSADGIVDNTFRIITSTSSDEFLYFGSHNGISRVNISQDYQIKAPPVTYITEANLINKSGEQNLSLIGVKEISLPANNYYLALKFIGLEYNRMEKTKYAYKLEGFDEEWFYPKKNIPAVYTNLKPGDYIFKSKTANNEGVWSEEIAELKIKKEPKFIERPWVRFVLVLLSLFLLLGLISMYTSSIKKNNLRLQSFNDNLNNEIRERKKIEEDLMQTNKDLQQFAYGASHDLQEPLRNIGNAVGLLKRKNDFDDQSNEFVDIAVDGVKRMSSLIENLLNYAKSGSQSASIENVDLNKIVNDKLLDLSQLIAYRKAKITVEDLPTIPCEVHQIGIVFYNLINNGIKFNKSKIPEITISCKEENNKWLFSVKDNGIGIPKDYQSKIFSIFTRLENKRDYEGTGIGLSLCQKIVVRHNGTIWINSKEGEGSTFYFTISKNLGNKVS